MSKSVTKSVGVHAAKTHLSRLLDDVAAGEDVLITRRGVPAARLVAPRRRTGASAGTHAARGVPGDAPAADVDAGELGPEEAQRRAERLRAIVADAAKRWVALYRDADHGDLLYDERGLPRDVPRDLPR